MASAELTRVAGERMAARPPDPPPDLATRRAGFDANAPAVPEDVTVLEVSAGGVPADWVCAPGASEDRRILYLHGGGYSIGSKRSHGRIGSDISRASGAAVLVLDYRLAPEAPYPAAVEDALAAYRWMRANGPSGEAASASSFIAGDSAGGGLTLATVLAAVDAGVPAPDACVTLSAWTDLGVTGTSVSTRAAVDPILSDAAALTGAASMYLGSADPETPQASPLHGNYEAFPPLLMQVGDREILLDDTLRVAERARAAGVDVQLHVEPEGYHVYPFMAPEAPESQQAITQIGEFVRAHS